MIKVLFICHSTMAQSVFCYTAEQEDLKDLFSVCSAATSREEIGNPPHPGTARKLRDEGIPLIPYRAVQMKKIFKMLYFSGDDRDVADPWYTGDFDAAFRDITEGCRGLLRYIRGKERF